MNDDQSRVVIRGLRGVVAATTKISFVDPLGSLYYSGYNIDELVGKTSYDEVVYLLLNNKLPTKRELEALKMDLFSALTLSDQVIERLKATSPSWHPIDVLRTEISHLGEFDPDPDDNSTSTNRKRAIQFIAKIPVITSFLYRIR